MSTPVWAKAQPPSQIHRNSGIEQKSVPAPGNTRDAGLDGIGLAVIIAKPDDGHIGA